MRKIATHLLTPLLLIVSAANADLADVSDIGFTVKHERVVDAERAHVWRTAVGAVGDWWSDDHTVSGDAGRMSIDARPLGCFCENLEGDNGIVHLTVTSVSQNVMLRMTGGLGPLGLMGVNGNMTWEFFDDEAGTRVRFTYAVGGYYPGGLEAIAGAVDAVIGEALELLKARVETASEPKRE